MHDYEEKNLTPNKQNRCLSHRYTSAAIKARSGDENIFTSFWNAVNAARVHLI